MFEKIFDNLKDGLIVFDRENKVSLINTPAKEIFGIGENFLGKSIEEFANFPKIQNLFFLLGKEIKEVFRREIELGENLILEVTSIPIFEEGKKTGSIVVLHDITREKTIERLKSEFVSVSAHQLRTPLASIKWSLETLLKERVGKLNEDQERIVKKAFNSTERMLTIVNDLLNVVRIEEGKYIYRKVSTNFEDLVKSKIEFFEEKMKEKQIQFEFRVLPKKLPKVKIDPEKISLVIENLLDNAIRYNFVGGTITISLDLKNDEIEFSIEDSGIGIPESEKSNIFQKFFRASNALKKETEGSGLGLFVAKNIVEAHGGRIWFESEEGKGTTFHFTIPIK
jgi:PAS domain S-box-containing protein